MKLKFLTTSLAILTLVSCHQENKNNDSTSEEDAVLRQGPIPLTIAASEKDSGVYFVNINDGEKVSSPVFIEMGVKGMEVEPAGKIDKGKGHHHIIIDDNYIEKGQMVPKDDRHIHFGKGQISDTLKLSPGKHTLTLQFANGAHQSYGKDWSKTITVEVEK